MAATMCLMILPGCENIMNRETSKDTTINNVDNNNPIPDSVIQFLLTSAAKDFKEHQPPEAIDFKSVQAGYIKSGNVLTYLICGEFLSKEKKVWESFTTIKTSGYEQYIGSTMYCEKATFINTDNKLSEELKRKFSEQ